MMTLSLAFYRGKQGTIWDKLICLVTGSEFSHVELCLDMVDGYSKCWSSATYANGVRLAWMKLDPKSWELVPLQVEISEDFFYREQGKPYDYVGLLGTIIKLPIFSRQRKWFCSEIVAEALGLKDSWKYTPADLYKLYSK